MPTLCIFRSHKLMSPRRTDPITAPNYQQWLNFILIIFIPIVGMAFGFGATLLLKIDKTLYSNLIINLFLLLTCVSLIRFFKFSWEDLGLKVIKMRMKRHVVISMIIFSFYILFYIFVIRISNLKPFSPSTVWSLLTYLVVVISEELYFRGVLYGFFEKGFSSQTAMVVSSLLFGLYHAQQGINGVITKTVTGWLWGSVRYSSGMIFLLIIPIHFAFNTIWLLFEGNWTNSPIWAMFALPAVEFLIGLANFYDPQ